MLSRVLEVLFPPRCPVCRRFLADGPVRLCEDCCKELDFLKDSYTRLRPPLVDGVISVLPYEGEVRLAMHRYKYRGGVAAGPAFGRLLAGRVESSGLTGRVDAVCWVPCHRSALRRRGYDQAEVLARAVAQELGKPVAALLKKVRRTKPMNKLNAAGRRANVLGAFCADCPPGSLQGASILLVDDIVTTGSTLSECARVLREAGAHHVYGATFAKTPLHKAKAPKAAKK